MSMMVGMMGVTVNSDDHVPTQFVQKLLNISGINIKCMLHLHLFIYCTRREK